MAPEREERTATGWRLAWQYSDLIAA